MAHTDNLKNQEPHGLGNLGQISRKAYPRWVVVENAGMESENIANDFWNFKEACENITDWYGEDEREAMNVQIMMRLPDGTLTTEY